MKNQDLDSWLEYLDSFKIFKTEILQDKLRSLYKKIIKLSPSTKVIIVGGTNGKGSTVEFLTQLLVLNNIFLQRLTCDYKTIIYDLVFLPIFFSFFKSLKIKKIVFKGVLSSCTAAALKEPTSVIFF